MHDAADPIEDTHAEALVAGQLRLLGELAELGLEVARAVAAGTKREGADLDRVALAYARVSRAVRLTVMLQSQVLEGGKAARARRAAPAEQASAEEILKGRVQAVIHRIAKAERGYGEEADELADEAVERLDDEDLYGDLMDHPMSEIVARICKDLGLSPDWAALAEELWAKREIGGGEAGAPLRAFLPSPPLSQSGGGGDCIADLGPLSPLACPRADLRSDPGETAPPPAGEHAAPS